MDTQVTKPIEDVVVSLNGIDQVRSFSREGVDDGRHFQARRGCSGSGDASA
ncbi:MAG: efflux RND transporter permease subunit [Polyangiaceae bacterium]|nr:efflux RND transporter permease subunit [Polyangiaceae bacterium]